MQEGAGLKNKVFVLGTIAIAIGVFAAIYLLSLRPSSATQEAKQAFTMAPTYRFNNHTYGNPSAVVMVVEFFDPECEACRQVHPIMKRLIKEYGGKVKFVHRYMPLHGGSMFASAALEEARELNKYDEALDILFERQPIWGDHANPRPELISVYLMEIGIPKDKLTEDYLMNKHGAKVMQDRDDGKALGVKLTPTIIVNGTALNEIGESAIRFAIEDALKMSQQK